MWSPPCALPPSGSSRAGRGVLRSSCQRFSAGRRRWRRGVVRCRRRWRRRADSEQEAWASSWLVSSVWLSIAHIAVPGRDSTYTILSSGKPEAHQSIRMSPTGTNLPNERSFRTHHSTGRSCCATMWTDIDLPGSWPQCASKIRRFSLPMNRRSVSPTASRQAALANAGPIPSKPAGQSLFLPPGEGERAPRVSEG